MTPEIHSEENMVSIDTVKEILSRLGLNPEIDEHYQNKFYCRCGSATFNGDCMENGFFSLAYDLVSTENIPIEKVSEVSNWLNTVNHLVKISVVPVKAPKSFGCEEDLIITRFEVSSINLSVSDLEKNICSYISYINEVVSLFKDRLMSSDHTETDSSNNDYC